MEVTKSEAKNRITAFLDEESFVEIGKYISEKSTNFNTSATWTQGDGVITGYGLVEGRLVYVYSQDLIVLNATIGEMHGKKIAKLYDLAIKSKSPIVGFIDCGGIRLKEGLDAIEALGSIYIKQTMASGVIPQIVGIFGNCGGGLALINSLVDFTYLESGSGKLFVNAPATLQGNKDFTLYPMHRELDGIGTSNEIIEKIRALIRILPASNREDAETLNVQDDLNRMIPEAKSLAKDSKKLLSSISDNGFFIEVKEQNASDMITGFIKLNGNTVGAMANASQELTAQGCNKAAEFVSFLNAFDIPLVTLTNVHGFKNSIEQEAAVGKAAGLFAKVLIHSDIPKINVITERGLGSSYLVFNSKHIGADIVLAWEDSEIGAISSENAAKVFCKDEKELMILNKTQKEYEKLQNNPMYAATRGYIDEIIQPQQTRQRIIATLEMIYYKEEMRPSKKHIVL